MVMPYGGSINICGNGSLVINADKADDYSVGLLEGTNSVLSVADTCNVTIYSGTKAAVYTRIISRTNQSGIMEL